MFDYDEGGPAQRVFFERETYSDELAARSMSVCVIPTWRGIPICV